MVQDLAYWSSWAVTHLTLLAVSGLALALVCRSALPDSDWTVFLCLFWLIAAALTAFAYFVSTLFASTTTASNVVVIVYGLALLPG